MTQENKERRLVCLLIVVVGWGHLRDYNAWAGGCIVESVTSAKGEPGLTSLSAVGTKGRGRDDAEKLSTHIQKWSQTPHCTI